MPHEVEVPKQRPLVFPDGCVVCNANPDGHTVRIAAGASGYKPLREPLGQPWAADVPACHGHVGALLRSRSVGKLLFGGSIAVSVAALLAMIELAPSVTGWASWLGVAAAVGVPLFLANRAYTPIFGIEAWGDRLVLAFRSRAYAESFAALNEAKLR